MEAKCDARIQLQGMTFGYASVELFHEFSWDVTAPIAVLEGPSGCGKTTLLRLLAGELSPSQARVWEMPRPHRLVLQDDGLFPWLTAEGNLRLSGKWPGFHGLPETLQRLSEFVRPYADKVVGRLSFGQRRLVELLRVLVCPAPLILLDEPLNFLDATRRGAVSNAIDILASRGYRFVISSHSECEFAQTACQRFRFVGDMPYSTLQIAGSL